ncbi:MAG: GTPase Era, partial [Fusobacteria bacterium]|nr:GTPase Era [Fusobacteriota bacterium]
MKSGFVAIIGRPNAGKSTLLNQLIKEKLAIISNKAQTTRDRIKGVVNTPSAQIVFVDTPGIHKPKHLLGEYMTKTALSTIKDVDAVLVMIDGSEEIGRGDEFIFESIKGCKAPIIVGINKIDKLSDDEIESQKFEIKKRIEGNFTFVTLSAEYNMGIERLTGVIESFLPEGEPFYPEDMYTDYPMYKLIPEIVREKILKYTEEEIPHSVAVTIDHVERRPNGKDCYTVNIYVERQSQKGIIIGAQGKNLKQVGIEARKEI